MKRLLLITLLLFAAPTVAADKESAPKSFSVEGVSNTNVEFKGTASREANGYLYIKTTDKKTIRVYPPNIVSLKFVLPDESRKALYTARGDARYLLMAGWLLDKKFDALAKQYLLVAHLQYRLDERKLPAIVALYKTHRRPVPLLFGGKLPSNVKHRSELIPRVIRVRRQTLAINQQYAEAMAKKMKALAPQTHKIETAHFVIYSAWSKADDATLVKIYTKLYPLICKQYRMDPREHVWVGKLPVFAFWDIRRFSQFSRTVCGFDARGAGGFSSKRGDLNFIVLGPVLRSGMSRAAAKKWFSQLLSHETSHAFLSRYRSTRPIPSWLNEGMAEIVAEALSPGGAGAKKMLAAHAAVKRGMRLKSSFFVKRVEMTSVAYGSAQSLARFLTKKNAKGFLQLLERLKQGTPMETALKAIYGLDYDGLLAEWHKSIAGK